MFTGAISPSPVASSYPYPYPYPSDVSNAYSSENNSPPAKRQRRSNLPPQTEIVGLLSDDEGSGEETAGTRRNRNRPFEYERQEKPHSPPSAMAAMTGLREAKRLSRAGAAPSAAPDKTSTLAQPEPLAPVTVPSHPPMEYYPHNWASSSEGKAQPYPSSTYRPWDDFSQSTAQSYPPAMAQIPPIPAPDVRPPVPQFDQTPPMPMYEVPSLAATFVGYPPPPTPYVPPPQEWCPSYSQAPLTALQPIPGTHWFSTTVQDEHAENRRGHKSMALGRQMLEKMGYQQGQGLGAHGEGRQEIVEPVLQPNPRFGLGSFELSSQATDNGRGQQPLSQTSSALNSSQVPFSPSSAREKARPSPSPSKYSATEPMLCPEQEDLVNLIMSGRNVFYTGSAGCGKSTVLKALVRRMRAMDRTVRIIAPTGRAALNVGGSTTWTFAGWTPDSHKRPLKLLRKAAHGKLVHDRLKETDCLIIDEISMVENLHFERLNELMKEARFNPSLHDGQPAFGGAQIVVTGDFCQLPPVKPFQHCIWCGRELRKTIKKGEVVHVCNQDRCEFADKDKWAFRSKAWKECNFAHVHLKTIHRQNDQDFIRMLQKCRIGSPLTDSETDLLMNHKCRVAHATQLYCTRNEADRVNQEAFTKLAGINHTYWSFDTFKWNRNHLPLRWKTELSHWKDTWTVQPPKERMPLKALDEHRFSECVQLKRGMFVVLLVNLDLPAGLCNGSQGIIVGFEDFDPAKMPTRDKNSKTASRIIGGEHAGMKEQETKSFITCECAPIKKWPVVQFHNGQRRTIFAECSVTELGDEEPYSLLARTQIPLAPAWAMTVHKSQSLTLDRVIVDLSRAFEEGQVYVALSRATGLQGLKIKGDGKFLRNKCMVNPEVAEFLKEKFGDLYDLTSPDSVSGS